MAPATAACPSLHELEGSCEYCGEPCDSTQDELNAINCTFEGCPSPEIYHQSCIEAYLKSIRLDKQRKTGFQCPRGCGKGSKWDKPCPGRVTKSHPIHARNDSSKKRRKAKMPDPAPQPAIAAALKKQAAVSRSKSMKSDKEKSPDVEENKATAAPAKAQVLNRASTFPTGDKSCAVSSSIGEIQCASAGGRTQNSKVGPLNGNTFNASCSEKCSDTGSADTSDSEDSVSSQQSSTPSKDFKEALSGSKYGVTPPVANAWASGRPRNGEIFAAQRHKDEVPAVPLEIRPPPLQAASQPENFNASPQQSQSSQPSVQPMLADLSSLEAEELELEERRKRARTKNEKKHVQRAAARLRERREALLAAAQASSKQPLDENRTSTPSPEGFQLKIAVPNYVDANGHLPVRPWSQSCLTSIADRKSTLVVKQLENLGFATWQCLLSVRVNGIDLHHCLDWLLRNGSKNHANMPSGPGQAMDIRLELKQLDDFRKLNDFTQEQIESMVISKGGDVHVAIEHLKSGGRGEVRDGSTLLRAPTSPAQIPVLASRAGSTFGASCQGSNSSSLDGQLVGSDSKTPVWPSHSRNSDFQSPNQFAGGECISDLSRYNARIGSENGYMSPKEGLQGSVGGRQGFAREAVRPSSSAVQVPRRDVFGAVEPFADNFPPFASAFSRQSSLKSEVPYGRSPSELGSVHPFTHHVKDNISRSVSGSGLFDNKPEHGLHDNGPHASSLFSEPTVSTVTSVTAAVLNDGRIDEQAIARMTESMDSTECAGFNTSHLHRIWGTQGLDVGSSSFYSSDMGSKLNSSSAALSQVFSGGLSALADSSSSFGVSGRSDYSGNWASNSISKSALTESIRSLGLTSGYSAGSSGQGTAAKSTLSCDYPYGEAGCWSEAAAVKPQHCSSFFGVFEQTQTPFTVQQQQQQPLNGPNGLYGRPLVGGSDYPVLSSASQFKTAGLGNVSSIWHQEQQASGARQPVDELGHDSLVNHLVEMLKV